MIARYASSIMTATAVTFSLFYLMQILIVMQPGIIAEPRSRLPLIMIPPERERPVEAQELPLLKKFIEPPMPPSMMKARMFCAGSGSRPSSTRISRRVST